MVGGGHPAILIFNSPSFIQPNCPSVLMGRHRRPGRDTGGQLSPVPRPELRTGEDVLELKERIVGKGMMSLVPPPEEQKPWRCSSC